MVSAILTILATILYIPAFIWLVVEAFKTSVGWGVATLCCGPAALFFAISHWDRAKYPFMICVVCNAFLLSMNFKEAMNNMETQDRPKSGYMSDRDKLLDNPEGEMKSRPSDEDEDEPDALDAARANADATNAAASSADGMPTAEGTSAAPKATPMVVANVPPPKSRRRSASHGIRNAQRWNWIQC